MGHRWLIHATVLLVSLLVIVRAIVVNMQSSDVVEVANTLHVMADNTSLKEEEVQVDPKGYIMFCPCMGELAIVLCANLFMVELHDNHDNH